MVNYKPIICEIAHGSEPYWASVALREGVLRRPLGLRFTADELAAEATSCHLAAYCGDRLAACLVLRPLADGEVQMRQVAVAVDFQRQGIGTTLVDHAEALARQRGFRRMVLHAREPAVAFYEKRGYMRLGNRFEEVTIPHWMMEKRLAD